MIKNCVFCLTEAECTACATGYFIDRAKKCCPSYLTNCAVCSQANMCTQCVDSFYVSETGTCVQCSSTIANCFRCANATFCFQCAEGYSPVNFASCKAVNGSGTNTTTNTTSNTTNNTTNTTNSTINNTTNNNNTVVPDSNNTESEKKGLSLWLILFISVAGGTIYVKFSIGLADHSADCYLCNLQE
jgi:hypothetical protein